MRSQARPINDKFMAERVVVKQGAKTYEFTYSNYKDWNNPLNPAEAFYAGKMTEKQNGAVVRDITTTLTETGQMYVVVPVPASVMAAMKPTNQPPNWTLNADAKAAPTQTASAVTPRLADGHPDMTGNWGGPLSAISGSGTRRCGPKQMHVGGISPDVGCKQGQDNFWLDYEWISPSRFGLVGNEGKPSHPTYKPEFLGQGSGTRSVDQQGRSDHDLSADGNAAGGYTVAHYAVCDRHLFGVYNKRLQAAEARNSAGDPRPTQCALPKNGSKATTTAFRSVNGRATRWSSIPPTSSIPPGSDAAAFFIPPTCT